MRQPPSTLSGRRCAQFRGVRDQFGHLATRQKCNLRRAWGTTQFNGGGSHPPLNLTRARIFEGRGSQRLRSVDGATTRSAASETSLGIWLRGRSAISAAHGAQPSSMGWVPPPIELDVCAHF
jgi:hypothetical protein